MEILPGTIVTDVIFGKSSLRTVVKAVSASYQVGVCPDHLKKKDLFDKIRDIVAYSQNLELDIFESILGM